MIIRVHRTCLLAISAVAIATAGCVTKGTYRSAVDELTEARLEHQGALEAEQEARDIERGELERELEDVRSELAHTRDELAAAEGQITNLRNRLASEVEVRERLETALQRTGSEADLLRRRVQALSAVEAEIRSRNQIYGDMLGRFRSLIDAGPPRRPADSGRGPVA